MMKKFLIFIFLLTGMLIIFAWAVVNCPWVSGKLIAKIAGPALAQSGVKLESVHIDRQRVMWPDDVLFLSVACRITQEGRAIDIKAERVEIKNLLILFENALQPIEIPVRNLTVKADDWRIDGGLLNLSLYFRDRVVSDVKGALKVSSLQWGDMALTDIRGPFQMKGEAFYFDPLEARFSGAALKGKFVLAYAPALSYSMDIDFQDLDLSGLTTAYPAVADKVRGVFSGALNISGEGENIKALQAEVHSPAGAQVQAELLKPLLPYIPRSQQYLMLEQLIAAHDFVFFEKTNLKLTGVGNKTLRTAVDMKSARFNLDVNLTVDLNVDEGFSQILETFKLLPK